MPELPEVETVRRVIEPQISGHRIESISIARPEVVVRPSAEKFVAAVVGRTVTSMGRRGKFLIFYLQGGGRMILHLRMTGCLLLAPRELTPEKHTHVVMHLDDGKELRFSDTRRFGRFWFIGEGEEDIYSGIGRLGKEALAEDYDGAYLQSGFGGRKKSVKECLLDQSVLAGIGNIYADEILFRTGINPARPANGLTAEEWERLAAEIPTSLAYFVEKNAISAEEYLKTKGKEYRNTPFLQVYGHAGEPCPRCGKTLERTTLGGRGSVFCPHCQK